MQGGATLGARHQSLFLSLWFHKLFNYILKIVNWTLLNAYKINGFSLAKFFKKIYRVVLAFYMNI